MKGKVSIEKAASGRSRCCKCGELIAKGAWRVVEKYVSKFTKKDKYCKTCGVAKIEEYRSGLAEMAWEIL